MQSIPIHPGQIWQCFQNGLIYKVLMIIPAGDDGRPEIIASTMLTDQDPPGWSWLSNVPEFLQNFKPLNLTGLK